MRFDRVALGPVRAAARSSRGIFEGEAEKAIDALLAGPLPEAVGRSLIEHRVLERVASEMVEASAAKDGQQHLEALTAQVVESPAFKRALADVLTSPEVRHALTAQTAGFGEDVALAVRTRLERLDDRIPRKPSEQTRAFGGAASRGVGLVIDAALAQLAYLAVAGSLALVLDLAGGLRQGAIAGGLFGAGWFVVTGIYFVLFWSSTGQTPGLRLTRLRVITASGASPSLLRSLVRFVGLILAIIPLLAGFLPVLFDDRRRALQDFMAGTVVVRERT
ncbi:MAG TPA: RDD family protein [Gaiellaceae bacterium]